MDWPLIIGGALAIFIGWHFLTISIREDTIDSGAQDIMAAIGGTFLFAGGIVLATGIVY